MNKMGIRYCLFQSPVAYIPSLTCGTLQDILKFLLLSMKQHVFTMHISLKQIVIHT